MTRRRMITGVSVGVGAAVALILALAGRGGAPPPRQTHTVSFAPPATGGGAAARRSTAATPRPRPAGEVEATEIEATSSAPSTEPVSTEPVVERGVALALRIRDDICRCETRECWSRTNAIYKGKIGLALPKTPEETKVFKAAMAELSDCVKRIDAEDTRARAEREATLDAPEGG
ncbi:hypothetical protein [Sorangium sp. So ce362]|uniref:hypothetical protein n=1 Tax=Sorangium sp. So ce362 TaxID=3133303 RepID=UPI003F6474C1